MPVEVTLDLIAARGTAVVKSMKNHDMTFEPEVASLLVHLFRNSPRGLFIDVGSNIGYFPLLLAKYCQATGARIDLFAHEPLPRLQRVSRRLQEANGVRFHLEPTAVSDRSGSADFYVSAVSDTTGSLVAGFREARKVIRVDVRTLDSMYLGRLSKGPVGEFVVLIDVETGEPAVLRGARGIMERYRPLIICEVLFRTEQGIVEALDGMAYALYRFDGQGWVRDSTLVGDREYRIRDWLFVPTERVAEFGDSFTIADPVALTIKLA